MSNMGPSSSVLLKSHADSSNWILPAGSYTGNRAVQESEITPDNVDKMKVAWTFKVPDKGPVEASPIVWNGTIYITSSHNDVYAIGYYASYLQVAAVFLGIFVGGIVGVKLHLAMGRREARVRYAT